MCWSGGLEFFNSPLQQAKKCMNTQIQKAEVSLQSPKALMKFAGDLKAYIVKQNLFTPIAGKNYVNVEGWQFAGGNLGIFPLVESCDRLDRGTEITYRASVALYSGEKIVSRGIAICSNKENRKKSFDEYAIASMAQTRAEGKAYRLIIGWLMKAAGYESTPSEEATPIKSVTEVEQKEEKGEEEKTGVDYVSQIKKYLFKHGAKNEVVAIKMLNNYTGEKFKTFSEITQAKAKQLLPKLLISKK